MVDFQRNHRISKIVLCGNATSELEQPRQRWRKREKNKSNRFNKQNRNSEHEADFWQISSPLWHDLRYQTWSEWQCDLAQISRWSSFQEQRLLQLRFFRNTHSESHLCIYTHKVGSSVTFTQRPGTHTTQTILAAALLLIDFFFFCQRL